MSFAHMNIFSKFAITSNKWLLPKQFSEHWYKCNISVFRILLSMSSTHCKVWGHNRFEIWFKKFHIFENFRFFSKFCWCCEFGNELKIMFYAVKPHLCMTLRPENGYFTRILRQNRENNWKNKLENFHFTNFSTGFFEILATIFELFLQVSTSKTCFTSCSYSFSCEVAARNGFWRKIRP
jgi:hypothetical protein